MTENKTLKQKLQELPICPSIERDIIKIFEEWLTQKHPENIDSKTGKHYKGTQIDLNELLEEFNNE